MSAPSTVAAASTVDEFFAAYRRHDVEQMVDLCTDTAAFRYVPVEFWGKQRVVRGDGNVRTIGKIFWTGLIDAFPDLTNDVTNIIDDGAGNVAVEVTISGTQAKDWGTIGTLGKHYDLPHLFLFHLADDGQIDRIVAYWDGADYYRQLGRVEID